MKTSTLLTSLLVCLTHASLADAQCTKDIECKGQRICEAGRCSLPGATSAAQAGAHPKGANPTRVTLASLTSRPPTASARPLSHGAAPNTCRKDIDCPGATVCEQARCVTDPAPSPASGSLVTPTRLPSASLTASPTANAAPLSFRVYGSVLSMFSLSNWRGKVDSDLNDNVRHEAVTVGVHAAVYAAWRHVHLGAFVSTIGGVNRNYLAYGLALKFGGNIRRNVWLGFAFDLGREVDTPTMAEPWSGGCGFAGLVVDVMMALPSGLKLAFVARLGAAVAITVQPSTDDAFWQSRMVLQLGLSFGV